MSRHTRITLDVAIVPIQVVLRVQLAGSHFLVNLVPLPVTLAVPEDTCHGRCRSGNY